MNRPLPWRAWLPSYIISVVSIVISLMRFVWSYDLLVKNEGENNDARRFGFLSKISTVSFSI